MMTHSKEELARIRWNCRRGMLELDIILENFFDNHYLQLAPADQKRFIELLACTDQQLWGWLMQNVKPENFDIGKMTAMILNANNL